MRASVITPSSTKSDPVSFKKNLDITRQQTLDHLQKLWKEAGYHESECNTLLGDLLQKLNKVCSEFVDEEKSILDHAKIEVQTQIDKYISLSAQLGRTIDKNNILKGCQNLTDKLAELDKMLESVSQEVSSRQKLLDIEYSAIHTLQKEISDTTDISTILPNNELPLSDAKLQSLKSLKVNLEKAKQERIEIIKSHMKECDVLLNELVIYEEFSQQKTTFQYMKTIQNYVNNDIFDYGTTMDDLKAIEEEYRLLWTEKEVRREELATTGAEIARLWALLRISTMEREQFHRSFKMNLSLDTLNKGRQELSRLLEIRSTSLTSIITTIRSDILVLWTELGLVDSNDQRNEFMNYFKSVDQIEDAEVEIHESYYKKLKQKVDELKPLLSKISKREIIVQERIELEHLALNPERLIDRSASGREERKREEGMTLRVRTLEKLTKEILSTIQTWEETNGEFIYMGQRYLQRAIDQEQQYIEMRDQLRSTRKKNNNNNNNNNNNTMSNTSYNGSGIGSSGNNNTTSNSGMNNSSMGTSGNLNTSLNTSGGSNSLNNSFTKSENTSIFVKPTPVMKKASMASTGGPTALRSQVGAPVNISSTVLAKHMQNLQMQQRMNTISNATSASTAMHSTKYVDENYSIPNVINGDSRMSTGSDETEYTQFTSMTEIREQGSVCTVKKGTIR